MEDFLWYCERARELGREGFLANFQGIFLFRRGTPRRDLEAAGAEKLPFRTVQVDVARTSGMSMAADDWIIAEIKKRPGKPFPERITVGRATNADVVLRFGFVSKLHAYFSLGAQGEHVLHDYKAPNGTVVNGRVVSPERPEPIHIGDRVEFGALKLEVIDAARLFEVLQEVR